MDCRTFVERVVRLPLPTAYLLPLTAYRLPLTSYLLRGSSTPRSKCSGNRPGKRLRQNKLEKRVRKRGGGQYSRILSAKLRIVSTLSRVLGNSVRCTRASTTRSVMKEGRHSRTAARTSAG